MFNKFSLNVKQRIFRKDKSYGVNNAKNGMKSKFEGAN